MLLDIKCSKSPLPTLRFLFINFCFEDMINKVFQEGIKKPFKVLRKAFFRADFVCFFPVLMTL